MTGIAQFAARWNQPWKVWSHTPRLNGSVFNLASSQDGTYIAPGYKSWVKQVLEIFAFTEITHFLPNTSARPCVFVDVRILRCTQAGSRASSLSLPYSREIGFLVRLAVQCTSGAHLSPPLSAGMTWLLRWCH